MDVVQHLIGTWELDKWHCTLDGEFHNYPFGRTVKGRLTYGSDGTMSAILMKPDRANFAIANLTKGTVSELKQAIVGYVSYAGHFHVQGDEVHHQVTYSLLPNWIGNTLIRTMSWQEGLLSLATLPEKSRTGRIVINHLRWRRLK